MTITDPVTAPRVTPAFDEVDREAVVTLRLLAADAVETARSGHPGLPMGAASTAWVLWSRHLRFDPSTPDWPERDRFVLSAGHGSALLYSLLHLTGFDLPMDELRRFRRVGSRTPGHPEHGLTPGVEVTTGPLGQGLATAVGIALAERLAVARGLAGEHRTYVLAGDGDLMEGVSYEAASLAGHLGLERLMVLWDDNRITIDGATDRSTSEDVAARFAAAGWAVSRVGDGDDLDAIDEAVRLAREVSGRPQFIAVRTRIGRGAPTKEGRNTAHGAPLGADELAGAKSAVGRDPAMSFVVPAEVSARCREITARASVGSRPAPPMTVPDVTLPSFDPGSSMATRVASHQAVRAVAAADRGFIGGSADLEESTGTALDAGIVAAGSYDAPTIAFGIREHAMAACLNGLALSGVLRPYGSTFLVFSDYLKPSLRLSALMRQPVVYILTHDSIGLGEDGPTHQPVEHLAALRAVPGVAVLRPADANETSEAWRVARQRTDGPTCLILTRQALPVLPADPAGWLADRGARVVRVETRTLQATVVGTGSEVSLAIAAAELLAADGIDVRVVSMPWRERFLALPAVEREALVPRSAPVIAVEAGARQGWDAVVGPDGTTLTLDRFGESGPGPDVMAHFGFTPENLATLVRAAVTP